MKRRPRRGVVSQRWRDDALRLIAERPEGHAPGFTLELGARSRLVWILWLAGPPERDAALGHAPPEVDDAGSALAARVVRPRSGRGRAN